MTLSHTVFAGLLAGGVIIGAAQQGLAQEWTLDGLEMPESAFYDAERGVIYVSNIVEDFTAKDGNGYISRVSPEGEMVEAKWVTGLDAPKGLILDGDTLYVSDVDQLVAIDVTKGEVSGRWAAEGAQFLNDTAVDGEGRVYVSDMLTNRIYVLDGDAVSVWLEDAGLMHPNGLKVDGDRMVVAAWGDGMHEDFSTDVGGHLLAVDMASKEISDIGSGEPVGNLDGLEKDGDSWLVTDFLAGALMRLQEDGSHETLQDLPAGSADLEFLEDQRVAVVPILLEGKLVAYKVE